MNPVYGPVYESYYRSLHARGVAPTPPVAGLGNLTDFMRRVIDDADAELQSSGLPQLRPDAKYLLLGNFAELVARPVLQVQPVAPGNLQQQLADDLRLLIFDAAKRAEGRGEISGHSVIDALSQSWKRLQVMSLNVWE